MSNSGLECQRSCIVVGRYSRDVVTRVCAHVPVRSMRVSVPDTAVDRYYVVVGSVFTRMQCSDQVSRFSLQTSGSSKAIDKLNTAREAREAKKQILTLNNAKICSPNVKQTLANLVLKQH